MTWDGLLQKKVTLEDCLEKYISENKTRVDIPIPKPGTIGAYETLESFKPNLAGYSDNRDFPFIAGTSKLAPYIKNGSITVPNIIYLLGLKAYEKKRIWKRRILFRTNMESSTTTYSLVNLKSSKQPSKLSMRT